MPMEIEVKVRVEGFEGVREALVREGAVRVGRVREVNVFYDRGGELRRKDCGLRVRVSVGEDGAVRGLMTFKGPAGKTGVRAREAFDVKVEPVEQVGSMLEGMGFEQVLLFEKDRETWEVGGCLVELDELPGMGKFVEVEGGEGMGEAVVREVQGRLGLGGLEDVVAGYSRMVKERVGKGGELRF
jgi:adenylate cyclase class 2